MGIFKHQKKVQEATGKIFELLLALYVLDLITEEQYKRANRIANPQWMMHWIDKLDL